MAFTRQQSPFQVIAAAATSQALTVANPTAGQLLVCGCNLITAGSLPAISVTDNGSAGWTQFPNSPNNFSGTDNMAWFYKIASATDASSLTTVTFSWTNGAAQTGGGCFMEEYHGFVGTPTLSLHPAAVNGTATTVTITGGVAAQATELALGYVANGSSLTMGIATGVNTYSPDNGTTAYAWTTTVNTQLRRAWAAPTASPATASKWVMTWTNSHPFGALGATFYDQVAGAVLPPLGSRPSSRAKLVGPSRGRTTSPVSPQLLPPYSPPRHLAIPPQPRGHQVRPVPSQAPVPPPTMTQFGTSPRRLSGLPLLGGHRTMPVAPQLNPPLNDKRRLPSFKRIVPQAKGRQFLAAPPQLNPPLNDARRLPAFKRIAALVRGHRVLPVPPQLNPPIVLRPPRTRPSILGLRKVSRQVIVVDGAPVPRGRPHSRLVSVTRGKTTGVPPAQVVVPPPPMVVTVRIPRRLTGWYQRRSPVVLPPAPQTQSNASTYYVVYVFDDLPPTH